MITKYSSAIFSTIYISTVIYLIYNSDPRIQIFIVIPAAVYLITKLIPFLYNRRRPFAEFSLKSLIKQRADHSFPSTHAASSLIISLAFLNISLELGLLLIFLAILTALSRIMVGVHYPTDIIGAWLLAVATHFLALIF
ncbi:MAG: phosphatase PAP2 family protein [Halanaerobium sp.]